MLIKLAWRNLWRNRGRTAILMTAISLSLALAFFQLGVGDYMHTQMEHAAARTAGGNVLVHAEGWWETQKAELVIEDARPILERAHTIEGVSAVATRLHLDGLLSSARGSSATRVSGIAPEEELRNETWSDYIDPEDGGDFFETRPGRKKNPIVLGAALVEQLDIELGDRVVVSFSGPDGETQRALFYLSGIVATGVDMVDLTVAFVEIAAAREALGVGDYAATQVGLTLDEDSERARVRGELVAALGDDAQRAAGRSLEVLTWDQAIPEMVGFIEIDDAFNYIFIVVIFLIIAFGIANTFLMAVMERVRELGLLGALGLTPGRVAQLVVAETVLIAAISIVIGLGLGLFFHWLMVAYGIDTRAVSGDIEVSGIALTDPILRSEIRPLKWAIAIVFVFVLVLVSASYPAFKASRLDPASAMRTYE